MSKNTPAKKAAPKRRKPGPSERAKAKAQQEAHARAIAAQESALDVASTMIHSAAEREFNLRVSEFVAQELLSLANKLVTENAKQVSSYLVAGRPMDQLPSSFRVENAASQRLQELAKDVAPGAIPSVLKEARA